MDLLRRVYVEAKRAGRQNEFFMFHLGANERLQRHGAGQVMLQLKSAFRDGTTHVVMSPLEFMQRLAALVPRPCLQLIRFHGVPGPAQNTSELAAEHTHGVPARMSWVRLLKKRVFDIDIAPCLHCGGALRIIAAIEDPA